MCGDLTQGPVPEAFIRPGEQSISCELTLCPGTLIGTLSQDPMQASSLASRVWCQVQCQVSHRAYQTDRKLHASLCHPHDKITALYNNRQELPSLRRTSPLHSLYLVYKGTKQFKWPFWVAPRDLSRKGRCHLCYVRCCSSLLLALAPLYLKANVTYSILSFLVDLSVNSFLLCAFEVTHLLPRSEYASLKVSNSPLPLIPRHRRAC